MTAALVAGLAGSAPGVTFEGVDVQIQTDWPNNLSGGYYPVRIHARNLKKDKAEIAVTLSNRDTDASARGVTREIEIEGHGSAGFTVLWPIVDSESNVTVRVRVNKKTDASLLSTFDCSNPTSVSAYGSSPQPQFAVVVVGPHRTATQLQADLTSSSGGGITDEPKVVSIPDPNSLPDTWLGYSGLTAVAVDWSTLVAMQPGRKIPLTDWVAAGGVLLVCGVDTRDEASLKSTARQLLGQGPVELSMKPADRPMVDHGFGAVAFLGTEIRLASPSPVQSSQLARHLRDLSSSHKRDFSRRMGFSPAITADDPVTGSATSNAGMLDRFKIPGVGEVPVRSFVVVMLGFVILVGPVNYVLLHRRRKLHWMLVTVPSIALLATLAVILYAFFAEGLGIKGRTATLTWLDSERGRAVTLTRQAYYAGIAPGAMDVGTETAVFPVNAGAARSRDLDWDEGQQLSSGWLPSRTEVQWVTLAVEPARQRVLLRRNGAGWDLVNGLGVEIQWVRVVLEDGTVWEAGGVPDGEAHALRQAAGASAERISRLRPSAFGATGLTLGSGMQLSAGRFAAMVDRPLFEHVGPDDIDQRKSDHAVVGTFVIVN